MNLKNALFATISLICSLCMAQSIGIQAYDQALTQARSTCGIPYLIKDNGSSQLSLLSNSAGPGSIGIVGSEDGTHRGLQECQTASSSFHSAFACVFTDAAGALLSIGRGGSVNSALFDGETACNIGFGSLLCHQQFGVPCFSFPNAQKPDGNASLNLLNGKNLVVNKSFFLTYSKNLLVNGKFEIREGTQGKKTGCTFNPYSKNDSMNVSAGTAYEMIVTGTGSIVHLGLNQNDIQVGGMSCQIADSDPNQREFRLKDLTKALGTYFKIVD